MSEQQKTPEQKDDYTFAVRVEITPIWIRPAELPSQEVGRSQAELRFAVLAHEIEQMIRATLEQMRHDHGKLPMRDPFTGDGDERGAGGG